MKLVDSPWHAWLAVILIWISFIYSGTRGNSAYLYGIAVGFSYLIFYK